MKLRVLLALGLAVPLSLAGWVTLDQLDAAQGTATVTVSMRTCANPWVGADGSNWSTDDVVPAADWVEGGDLTAVFDWHGQRGTLHLPHGDLAYSRDGQWANMNCRIG